MLVPPGPRFDALFERAIAPALAMHHLEVRRGRDVAHPGLVLKDECLALRRAELVVVVLVGRDPHVFYELGLCHGLRRSPILVVERAQDLPFDLLALPRVECADSQAGLADLREELSALVRSFLGRANAG